MTSTDWWRNAVIYQIYPRSFRDSDGDGIGDLAGIRERLGYVAELGADAVWICPFVRSPMKDFGYDVSDYQSIEPIFGTMEDFEALVDDAHARGLRVIMDQVWNHTSDQHPWFRESRSGRDKPKADWYVWADAAPDGGPPNNWRATFGGSAWAWDDSRRQYYLHNFLESQPDLNWYKPEVRRALMEIGRFWLRKGVDGFRLDVVNFLCHDRSLADNPRRPPGRPRPAGAAAKDPYFEFVNAGTVSRPESLDMLAEIRALMDEFPGTFTLGEISSAEDTLASAADFVRGATRLHTAYNASLISHEPFTHDGLYELIQRVDRLFADHRICWTFGTHDFPRLKGRWGSHRRHDDAVERRLDRMLLGMLVCLPGSCCIYQGDELGLTQATLSLDQMHDPYGIANYPEILGRDGCRTPMPWTDEPPSAGFSASPTPWLPVPAEHLPHAVSRQTKDPDSLLNAYRRLLHWRRQQPALLGTRLRLIETPPPILIFERGEGEHVLRCAFNLSVHAASLVLDDEAWRPCPPARLDGALDADTLRLEGYGSALLTRC